MRIFLLVLFVCMIYGSRAQEKTDSLAALIAGYYNSNAYNKLYQLGGKTFREQLTEAGFIQTGQKLFSSLGKMQSWQFETYRGKVAKYKAIFANATLSMFISTDDDNKLETFLLRPYEPEVIDPSRNLIFNNPRLSALDKKVDTLVRSFMARNNTVGCVLGVLRNGNMYTYGYGETKKGNGRIPDKSTLFEIGSISKTFTATLAAYLSQQNIIRLDQPVNKYLPDSIPALVYNGKPVTLISLSNHTSGLPRLPADLFAGANQANPYRHYDVQHLMHYLKSFKPVREPGMVYEYSNLGAGLLGTILERASGKSYGQLLKQYITEPLQMTDTRLQLSKKDSAVFAQGYNNEIKPVDSWEFLSLAAAGGIRSNIADMLQYARAQVDKSNGPLQQAIRQTHMTTFQKDAIEIGMGWHYSLLNGNKYLAHTGQTGGFASVMVFNTDTRNAVIILTNTASGPFDVAAGLISWMDGNQ